MGVVVADRRVDGRCVAARGTWELGPLKRVVGWRELAGQQQAKSCWYGTCADSFLIFPTTVQCCEYNKVE